MFLIFLFSAPLDLLMICSVRNMAGTYVCLLHKRTSDLAGRVNLAWRVYLACLLGVACWLGVWLEVTFIESLTGSRVLVNLRLADNTFTSKPGRRRGVGLAGYHSRTMVNCWTACWTGQIINPGAGFTIVLPSTRVSVPGSGWAL